jgi:hypothetical protein
MTDTDSKEENSQVRIGETEKEMIAVDPKGGLIQLDQLTEPFYSECNKCAIRYRCPVFDEDMLCRLEIALVDEAKRNIMHDQNKDIEIEFKLTMSDFLINLVLQHRLQRMGATIDYYSVSLDKGMLEILQKYVSMTASISRRYMEGLKELTATPREKMKYTKNKGKTSGFIILSKHMEKAIEEEEKEKAKEAQESI